MRFIPAIAALVLTALPAVAEVSQAKLQAFVEVTGYNVIIDSLQQGAMAGPGMTGNAAADFGKQYTALAEEVFDPKAMNQRALEMLGVALTDDLVNYGAAFYASDLGQRLVAVENESHMADDQERMAEGGRLVDEMSNTDMKRLQLMQDLATAVGSTDVSIRALVEMQVRFTMAAAAAGSLALGMSEDELRARSTDAMDGLRDQIATMGVIGNAYTYRALSNEDVAEYVRELKTPEMQQIYDVLNAVQYEIMIEKYEELGSRMGELKPETDL